MYGFIRIFIFFKNGFLRKPSGNTVQTSAGDSWQGNVQQNMCTFYGIPIDGVTSPSGENEQQFWDDHFNHVKT